MLSESPDKSELGAQESNAAPTPVSDLHCPVCRYNLRGVASNRCPECGLDLTDVKLGGSRIPWVHRDEIGHVRAYWKTVWLVSARHAAFATEIGRPGRLADAMLFRRRTIRTLITMFVVIAAISIIGASPGIGRNRPNYGELVFYWSIALIAVLCCLSLLTAIPYYALGARDGDIELEQRTAVLSLYAVSAPLAWMFVGGALVAAGLPDARLISGEAFDTILTPSGACILVVANVLAVNAVIRLIRRATNSSRQFWSTTLRIGAYCIGSVALTLVGIPAAFVLVAFAYYSFR